MRNQETSTWKTLDYILQEINFLYLLLYIYNNIQWKIVKINYQISKLPIDIQHKIFDYASQTMNLDELNYDQMDHFDKFRDVLSEIIRHYSLFREL